MRYTIIDIETNRVNNPDKLWAICLLHLDKFISTELKPSKEDVEVIASKRGNPLDLKESFIEHTKDTDVFVGHNIIGFDLFVLHTLLGYPNIPFFLSPKDSIQNSGQQCTKNKNKGLTSKNVLDTLILSRLFKPMSDFSHKGTLFDRRGGHSLEAWGNRLEFPKQDFHSFEEYSDTMVEYCINDVLVNYWILDALLKESKGFL